MAARLLATLLLSCLLLCVCAEPRVARCAMDANVKVPLSGVIAATQAEWTPQLSGTHSADSTSSSSHAVHRLDYQRPVEQD